MAHESCSFLTRLDADASFLDENGENEAKTLIRPLALAVRLPGSLTLLSNPTTRLGTDRLEQRDKSSPKNRLEKLANVTPHVFGSNLMQ
jgi:hypothetical protein